jgi:uncharacterized protein YecE (DUF72 family)
MRPQTPWPGRPAPRVDLRCLGAFPKVARRSQAATVVTFPVGAQFPTVRDGYFGGVPVFIGTSGWQYADWRGRLYPHGLGQSGWLEHYSSRFQTVEVNNAFYRLPEASVFERWVASTPDDFILSVKASRFLTHMRRLKEPKEPIERLMDRARHLGGKLGPILLQLPPTLQRDLGALRVTLESFPSGVRVAFEPRHPSWYCRETRDVLAAHGAAFCLSDKRSRTSPLWRTANWGYLRFHEGRANPSPCYGPTALNSWASRLAEMWTDSDDVYVYFNNDRGGCAVRDAHRFAAAVIRVGLTPTRVPNEKDSSLTSTASSGRH